jgi:hypothetical protein
VGVTADHGIVTLEGRPAGTEDIDAVCRLVWLVPGVVDVVYRATADAAASTGTDRREGA